MKNNMNLRYFCYHFKSTWLRMAIIVFICIIIAGVAAHDTYADYDRWLNYRENYPDHLIELRLTLSLGVFAAMAIILNLLLPMIELSRFNNRRYLDSAFTYPISRTALFSVHLITGYLHFLAGFTTSYLVYSIMLLRFAKHFDYSYIIAFFFISLVWSAFYYIFNAFFFSMCNATADGVLTALTWQYILCPAVAIVGDTLSISRLPDFSLFFIIFVPYTDICQYCTERGVLSGGRLDLLSTLLRMLDETYISVNSYLVWYLCIVAVIGAGLCALMIYTFNKKRAESAGEISYSPISYKTLIPTIVFILLYFGFEDSLTLFGMLALVFATIAYVIYRRSVKLKPFDLAVLGICFVLVIAGFLQ